MPAYLDSVGFYRNEAGFPAMRGMNRFSVMEVELDFAKIDAERQRLGLTRLAIDDSLRILKIPAWALVLNAGFEVVTGLASLTVALGDSAGATTFMTATSAATSGALQLSTAGGAAIKGYTAENYLLATFAGANPRSGKVRAFLTVVDIKADLGSVPGTIS
jgi:hypothetical protein